MFFDFFVTLIGYICCGHIEELMNIFLRFNVDIIYNETQNFAIGSKLSPYREEDVQHCTAKQCCIKSPIQKQDFVQSKYKLKTATDWNNPKISNLFVHCISLHLE